MTQLTSLDWHPQVYSLVVEGNYSEVAQIYEQFIENESAVISDCWYLGLAYLLQGNEAEAQAAWLLPLSLASAEEIDVFTAALISILNSEANHQNKLKHPKLSYLIRRHIQEIQSDDINNLLDLISLEIQFNQFYPQRLEEIELFELLAQSLITNVDSELLLQVLIQVLNFPSLEALDFAQTCIRYFSQEPFIKYILQVASTRAYDYGQGNYAAELIKICLSLKPDNLELLDQLFWFYIIDKNYVEALELAKQFHEQATSIDLKVLANYKILYVLLNSGEWFDINAIAQRHKHLLQEMLAVNLTEFHPLVRESLLGFTMPLLYLQDNPLENRQLQNQISRTFQKQLQNWLNYSSNLSLTKSHSQPLKIGYIGHSFRRHSVGWLCRWLLKYHDTENFQVYLYLVNQPEDDLTENWFHPNTYKIYPLKRNPQAIASQIQADDIDILVDLDSLTHNITSQVMCLKPAPIQVTWLGMDASGIPAIDYFIADPFVLPENAQTYYSEKIWRLPETYLAIDGFEVDVPTLSREDLGIPDDAVIYLSAQSGLKRHPDTIRLQLKVLKAVSNSYLLIKGSSNQTIIQKLFNHLAQEIEVNPSRLIFLPEYETEEIHRANLQIADIVLDTYPYNGATTTLEVLWMGIPLVTKVGEQFAARNSYTFLKNAGIEEGISWTDEEYLQWAIRLGLDKQLRQQVTDKLKKSRHIAPLWNARQFTQQMEQAYQQMWINLTTQH